MVVRPDQESRLPQRKTPMARCQRHTYIRFASSGGPGRQSDKNYATGRASVSSRLRTYAPPVFTHSLSCFGLAVGTMDAESRAHSFAPGRRWGRRRYFYAIVARAASKALTDWRFFVECRAPILISGAQDVEPRR